MLDPLLLEVRKRELAADALNRRFAREFAELKRIERLENRLQRARARYRLVRGIA